MPGDVILTVRPVERQIGGPGAFGVNSHQGTGWSGGLLPPVLTTRGLYCRRGNCLDGRCLRGPGRYVKLQNWLKIKQLCNVE